MSAQLINNCCRLLSGNTSYVCTWDIRSIGSESYNSVAARVGGDSWGSVRCIHRKGRDENQAVNTGNLHAPLPERLFSKQGCSPSRCATDGPGKQTRVISPSAHRVSCRSLGCRKWIGSAPGLRCPTHPPQSIHPLTRFSRASAGRSRHSKPASQLHTGKNAAKLWDAENLALKRHNYRVRLTEQQQNAQAGAKTRLRQQSYIYVSERRLNKHKPDGPKGLKLKPLLFFFPNYPIFAETG